MKTIIEGTYKGVPKFAVSFHGCGRSGLFDTREDAQQELEKIEKYEAEQRELEAAKAARIAEQMAKLYPDN